MSLLHANALTAHAIPAIVEILLLTSVETKLLKSVLSAPVIIALAITASVEIPLIVKYVEIAHVETVNVESYLTESDDCNALLISELKLKPSSRSTKAVARKKDN